MKALSYLVIFLIGAAYVAALVILWTHGRPKLAVILGLGALFGIFTYQLKGKP